MRQVPTAVKLQGTVGLLYFRSFRIVIESGICIHRPGQNSVYSGGNGNDSDGATKVWLTLFPDHCGSAISTAGGLSGPAAPV